MQKGRIIILFRLVIFVLCSCFSPQLTHTHTQTRTHLLTHLLTPTATATLAAYTK